MLNSILYTNELMCKIGDFSDPANCSFCDQTTETISHILFSCSISNVFWTEVNDQFLNELKSCRGLSLAYCDVIIEVQEKMDLFKLYSNQFREITFMDLSM